MIIKKYQNKEMLPRDTLSETFHEYFDCLYHYGIRFVKDEDLVKDAIQELFFRFHKNQTNLALVSNRKAFLMKSLRRQILNILELKHYSIVKSSLEDHMKIDFSTEDYYIKNQTEENIRKRVLDALNALPCKQREAIYLRYFEEMNYEEIALIMNVRIQSVKNSVQRGLGILRDTLTAPLYFYLIFKMM